MGFSNCEYYKKAPIDCCDKCTARNQCEEERIDKILNQDYTMEGFN